MRDHSNDEITAVRTELCQLDNISREINSKRVALLRRLDALQSNTRVLPPEALSLIFLHACLPHRIINVNYIPVGVKSRNGPFSPLFLGSISHTWREVAWSTPQLWTTLSLFIPTSKAKKLAPLLDLYLTNVRGLQITLRLTFDFDYNLDPADDPIARVFFKEESLRKLGTLGLRLPPASWLSYSDGLLPRITKFYLHPGSSTLADITLLTNAPLLREISLEHVEVLPRVSWPLITTLKLHEISAAIALRCLLESPNLVEFHYVCITHYVDHVDDSEESEEPPDLPNPLTLYHLKALHWSVKLNRASDLFFHRIRLPALRSLIWDQRKRPLADTYISGIWAFFRNLAGAPLTTLHIHGMLNMDIDFAKHIYHENTQIESLLLVNCNEYTLYSALASLIPGWSYEGQTDERRYLTKLKMVEVRHCEEDDYPATVLGESFGDMVTDLLIGRASTDVTSGLCINLVFYNMTEVRWNPEAMEDLQEFYRTGAGVQLLMEGEQISWLKDISHIDGEVRLPT